jgi:hypothetical protein
LLRDIIEISVYAIVIEGIDHGGLRFSADRHDLLSDRL